MITLTVTELIESKLRMLEALDKAPLAAWSELLRVFAASISQMPDGDDDVLAILAIDTGETLRRLAVHRGAHPAVVTALNGLREDPALSLAATVLALANVLDSNLVLCSPQVAAAIGRIEQCYSERLTLGELARSAGVSPAHLEVLFRRDAGVSVHEYVVRTRMTKAMELLRQGEKIEAIASLVGYRSRRAFHASFKKRFGASPQTFLYRARQGPRVLDTAADSARARRSGSEG